MNNFGRISVLFFVMLCSAAVSVAQWSSNPSVNIPVVTGGYSAADVIMLKDGAGGAFVVWDDMRVGDGNPKAFAQHFDKAGHAKWTTNGVEVCPRGVDQAKPQATVVGDGSLIVSWAEQYRDTVLSSPVPALFVQRISSSGSLMWGDSALALATPDYFALHYPQDIGAMTSDGHGGAYISWTLLQSGLQEIVMTRLDSTGSSRWSTVAMNGWGIVGGYEGISMAQNDTSGVYISWVDTRFLLYGQLVSSSGGVQWDSMGVALAPKTPVLIAGEENPRIIADGSGGAIYGWEQKFTLGGNSHIFAGRVNSAGKLLWVTSTDSLGVNVDSLASGEGITLTLSASGSVILTWAPGNNAAVAQRIAADGSYPWGATPAGFAANTDHEVLTTDDNGGVIIAWTQGLQNGLNIFAQRVNSSGQTVWSNATYGTAGNPVSTTPSTYQEHPVIVSDDAGGAIVAWYDYRNTTFNGPADVYIQHIGSDGSVTKVNQQPSGVPSRFALMQNYPNPFNPSTMIQFTVPSTGRAVLKVFNILGQEVATLFDGQAAAGVSHQVVFNASNYASGIYFSKLEFDGKTDIKKMMLLK